MLSTSTPFVVVAAIDFSGLSIRALDQALEIARLRHGEVHVLHVEVEPVTSIMRGVASLADMDAELERVRQISQARVDAAAATLGAAGVTRVVAHVRRGAPAQQIADLAATLDADLVVVGSHGRHGIDRLILGSVAESAVRLARCPVWIIRPKDHPAELKVPQIEPACSDCLSRRQATNGTEYWCSRHSEHHPRAHRYAYVCGGVSAPESVPYQSTPGG